MDTILVEESVQLIDSPLQNIKKAVTYQFCGWI